jgi:hypothetical protein
MLFTEIGSSGRLSTFRSPDDLPLTDVVWGGDTFVVVGNLRLRWSQDGFDWHPGIVTTP